MTPGRAHQEVHLAGHAEAPEHPLRRDVDGLARAVELLAADLHDDLDAVTLGGADEVPGPARLGGLGQALRVDDRGDARL